MLLYVTSDPAALHQVAGVLEAALLVEMIINKDNASGSLSPESCRGRRSHSNLICSQKAWGNQRCHHLRAGSMWTGPSAPLPTAPSGLTVRNSTLLIYGEVSPAKEDNARAQQDAQQIPHGEGEKWKL